MLDQIDRLNRIWMSCPKSPAINAGVVAQITELQQEMNELNAEIGTSIRRLGGLRAVHGGESEESGERLILFVQLPNQARISVRLAPTLTDRCKL